MFLRPLNRFTDTDALFLFRVIAVGCSESWRNEARSDLLNCASHNCRSSSRLKSFCFRVRFSVASFARNSCDIRAAKFRVVRQQLRQRLVNLRITFGKALAEFFGDTLHLKITARQVANSIAKTSQLTGEFVIIGVLSKLSGAQQFIVLQRLPAIFHRDQKWR